MREKLEGQPIRLIDAGLTSPVFSQSIYHAVAHAMNGSSPDTVILVSPSDPYVSIGIHQDLEKEVDTDYCRARGLTVIRREVGGGAVYLDRNQLFVQWVFRRGVLPARVDEQFELYVKPLVATYQHLGIDAYYRPVNDVHVDGRKIAGTGAARIGKADVIVGSFMFDFDRETMSKVLRVSSEKMRDKLVDALREYMTTMREQLSRPPAYHEVVDAYLGKCREAFQRQLVKGELTQAEAARAEQISTLLASPEWLRARGGPRRADVKIHEDVRVSEAVLKAPGGLIRATVRIRCGCVDDVELSGDFTMIPANALASVEAALRGCVLERGPLERAIGAAYETCRIQSPGIEPGDLADVLLQLPN